MTALMAQSLMLDGSEKVLDVGTGSGYHAAVLGGAGATRSGHASPAAGARQLTASWLRRRKISATVVCGDGSLGYPPEAPFDAISVAAGSPEVPPALLDQLRDPGRLVIPVGNRLTRNCISYKKRTEKFLHGR